MGRGQARPQRLYSGVERRLAISMKSKKKFMILWVLLIAVLFAGSLLTAPPGKAETIQTAMRDAVLHEENQISLFGWKNVNPGLISAMTVSAILLIAAACIRVFVIPKFKLVPGRFQLLLEQAVSLFDGMAKTSSPQRNGFLGAYIFGAGAYIFVGTLFELLGLQAVTTTGRSVTLPAPLSDVNGAIALGCLSYLVILSGGIAGNGLKGVGSTLKEFSLPISMSFRLFGALLSGLLVTELVYYYVQLSYVLPVLVGVLSCFFAPGRGCAIRATGSNPAMSRAQGINTNFNIVLGLAVSNGLVALSGALLSQYQGFADVGMGRGAIVIGLAAVIIGEALFSRIFHNFALKMVSVSLGAIIYYIVIQLVLTLGFDANLLKLLSASVVAVFLAVPYWKGKYFSKPVKKAKEDAKNA